MRSVKTIVKNVTLLNDCIVTFRLVYCLIADNSCSFGSIVPKALLSFVRVLTNILLLVIILVLLCRSLLDGLLYFIFNMTGVQLVRGGRLSLFVWLRSSIG